MMMLCSEGWIIIFKLKDRYVGVEGTERVLYHLKQNNITGVLSLKFEKPKEVKRSMCNWASRTEEDSGGK